LGVWISVCQKDFKRGAQMDSASKVEKRVLHGKGHLFESALFLKQPVPHLLGWHLWMAKRGLVGGEMAFQG
jgi:hypothetical protein